MNMIKPMITALLAATLAGCNTLDCVTADGEPEERTIELPAIQGVNAEGSIDVTITRGEPQRIVVRGPREIIDLIKTDVSKGIWTITTDGCYRTNRAITVEIVMADLRHAAVAGSGSITGLSAFAPEEIDVSIAGSGDLQLEVNTKDIDAEIAGSGAIRLRGTAGAIDVSIAGSGDLKAFELSTTTADVSIAGSGDVELTVIDKLEASVAGSGDVRYKGRPQVDSDIAGSGSVSGVE